MIVLLPVSLGAAVTVSFVDPDRYTDAGDGEHDPRQTMLEIERHLKALGNRYLSPSETLRIDVLNIDLAGRQQVSRHPNPGVRVMNGDADWPRIQLRYTLESNDGISGSVEETIVDRAYLRRIDREYSHSNSLPQEKRMLEEWFKVRFAEPKLPR